jgi:hypothetical protein
MHATRTNPRGPASRIGYDTLETDVHAPSWRDTVKKLARSLVLASALALMSVSATFAATGGAPAAHGLDGRAFGAAVSGLVTTAGGQALAAHVGK